MLDFGMNFPRRNPSSFDAPMMGFANSLCELRSTHPVIGNDSFLRQSDYRKDKDLGRCKNLVFPIADYGENCGNDGLSALAGSRRMLFLRLVPKLQLGNPVLEAPASSAMSSVHESGIGARLYPSCHSQPGRVRTLAVGCAPGPFLYGAHANTAQE